MTQTSDIFDVDMTALSLQESTHTHEKSMQAQQREMMRELRLGMMSKILVVSKRCNIDILEKKTISVIIFLSMKVHDKLKYLQLYLEHVLPSSTSSTLEYFNFDIVEQWGQLQKNSFNTVTDWIALFEMIEFDPCTEEKLRENFLVQHFLKSMHVANLVEIIPPTVQMCAKAVLHLYVDELPAAKLLERYLSKCVNKFVRDLEIRSLRAMTHFLDRTISSDEQSSYLMDIIDHVYANDVLLAELRKFIATKRDTEVLREETTNHLNRRMQLRYFQPSHCPEYQNISNTFQTWATAQKFSVVSSQHMQLLLYFCKAQVDDVPIEIISPYFSTVVLQRFESSNRVTHIDIHAMQTLLRSVRTYKNNVRHLIDFRLRCLNGLAHKLRESLSPTEIFQLYICVYQHDSIRAALWKSIVPVINHTIIVAIDKFRKEFQYEIKEVIENLTSSQTAQPVDDQECVEDATI
jgi:hypothetical protein